MCCAADPETSCLLNLPQEILRLITSLFAEWTLDEHGRLSQPAVSLVCKALQRATCPEAGVVLRLTGLRLSRDEDPGVMCWRRLLKRVAALRPEVPPPARSLRPVSYITTARLC